MEFLFGVLFGIFASIFNIGLFALNSDDTVCHCEIKENAELIAKILDFDVNGEIYQPVCGNADTGKYIDGYANVVKYEE